MAQNITWLGASYTGVEKITLPKTGGGTARFDDASITTATASDVVNGAQFLASNGTITSGSLVVQNYYTGSGTPSSSLGNDGDIYLQV